MTADLTQMPTPGLDDLTPERATQEIRGSVYLARRDLRNAEAGGNAATIKRARTTLAERLWYARAEKVAPFYRAFECRHEPRHMEHMEDENGAEMRYDCDPRCAEKGDAE